MLKSGFTYRAIAIGLIAMLASMFAQANDKLALTPAQKQEMKNDKKQWAKLKQWDKCYCFYRKDIVDPKKEIFSERLDSNIQCHMQLHDKPEAAVNAKYDRMLRERERLLAKGNIEKSKLKPRQCFIGEFGDSKRAITEPLLW